MAIDTSSLIAFLSGEEGEDVQLVERALAAHYGCFPPAVLAECLSAPGMPEETKAVGADPASAGLGRILVAIGQSSRAGLGNRPQSQTC